MVNYVDFNSMIEWFVDVGGYDVVLPFLLVFTVVFAVLQKTKILGVDDAGKPRKNFNVVISFVVGLLLVAQTSIVNLINLFIPRVSLLILVVLMFMLLIGLFGGSTEWAGFAFGVAIILSILGIIWALIPPEFAISIPYIGYLTQQDKAILLTVAIFILVIWFITKEEGPRQGEGFGTKFWRAIEDGFKGRSGGKE